MSIAKTGKAKTSGRAIDYVFKEEKTAEKTPEVIGGNVTGATIKEIKAEFRDQEKLNRRAKNTVTHISISFPTDKEVSNEDAADYADKIVKKLGYDQNPYLVVRHYDKDKKDDQPFSHIHIVASRIKNDGSLIPEWEIAERAIAATKEVDKQFKLESADYVRLSAEEKQERNIRKNEFQMMRRTGHLSVLEEFKDIAEASLNKKTNIQNFVKDIQAANFEVLPNISEMTGKMNGFSFAKDGIKFTAGKAGKQYKWANLSEKTNYLPERDTKFLQEIKAEVITKKVKEEVITNEKTVSSNGEPSVETRKRSTEPTGRRIESTNRVDERTNRDDESTKRSDGRRIRKFDVLIETRVGREGIPNKRFTERKQQLGYLIDSDVSSSNQTDNSHVSGNPRGSGEITFKDKGRDSSGTSGIEQNRESIKRINSKEFKFDEADQTKPGSLQNGDFDDSISEIPIDLRTKLSQSIPIQDDEGIESRRLLNHLNDGILEGEAKRVAATFDKEGSENREIIQRNRKDTIFDGQDSERRIPREKSNKELFTNVSDSGFNNISAVFDNNWSDETEFRRNESTFKRENNSIKWGKSKFAEEQSNVSKPSQFSAKLSRSATKSNFNNSEETAEIVNLAYKLAKTEIDNYQKQTGNQLAPKLAEKTIERLTYERMGLANESSTNLQIEQVQKILTEDNLLNININNRLEAETLIASLRPQLIIADVEQIKTFEKEVSKNLSAANETATLIQIAFGGQDDKFTDTFKNDLTENLYYSERDSAVNIYENSRSLNWKSTIDTFGNMVSEIADANQIKITAPNSDSEHNQLLSDFMIDNIVSAYQQQKPNYKINEETALEVENQSSVLSQTVPLPVQIEKIEKTMDENLNPPTFSTALEATAYNLTKTTEAERLSFAVKVIESIESKVEGEKIIEHQQNQIIDFEI